MAATTSKTKKTDVAKKPAVAAKPAVTEKVETVKNETVATTEKKDVAQEEKPAVTEESGLPFKVNSDGTVNIWSFKRAGKKVTGSTGEVVSFDEKGFAKVKLEDALHFQKVPGFSFTEGK